MNAIRVCRVENTFTSGVKHRGWGILVFGQTVKTVYDFGFEMMYDDEGNEVGYLRDLPAFEKAIVIAHNLRRFFGPDTRSRLEAWYRHCESKVLQAEGVRVI